jgi:hypothetical protein
VLETLPAGRELRISDVIEYFRQRGYDIPGSGPGIVGSLRVHFLDVLDEALVSAGSRTSTPNPNADVGGSFGLFAAAVPTAAASASATIYGLREDASFRSNLAVVDVPNGTGPAVLSLQIWDGDAGRPAGDPILYTLQAGDWRQFGSILAQRSVTNGWVTLSRTGGGTNGFLAYGVVNDGGVGGKGTSDGSFVAPDAAAGLVPIVLRIPSGHAPFTTELILVNPAPEAVEAELTYTPSNQLAPGPPVTGRVPIGAGRQLRIPDVVSYLSSSLGLPLPAAEIQGGTLMVAGAVALARISNPNPDAGVGGTFGLSYPAAPASARARTEAWIYGLRQDAESRSNLAVADARVGDAASVAYAVDVFDADAGGEAPVKTFGPIALTGGQWIQLSGFLGTAGITHGYARVRTLSGASDFVAYGVINDGAAPGQRTSDGSYVPMSGAR